MSDQPSQDYIKDTPLAGLLIIERPTFEDDRGFFRETFRKADLESRFGQPIEFVQANHSRSSKNTLRGIHVAPWHKLISVASGQVQGVFVDLRPESATFGQYVSVVIGDQNRCAVLVPAGFGNSFAVLSDQADYIYMTTDYWAPGKEITVRYDDPDLAIQWEVAQPDVSERDRTCPTVREAYPQKFSS